MTVLLTRTVYQAPGEPLPRRLSGPALLSNSAVTLYSAWRSAGITMLHVSNPSGSALDVTISIGSDAQGTRILDSYAVRADWAGSFKCYYVLQAGEVLQGFASVGSVATLTVSGYEIT